jgi:hypothetical protein
LFTIAQSSDGYPSLPFRTSFEINDDILGATDDLTPIVATPGIIGSVPLNLISGSKRSNRYHRAVRQMDTSGVINNHGFTSEPSTAHKRTVGACIPQAELEIIKKEFAMVSGYTSDRNTNVTIRISTYQ